MDDAAALLASGNTIAKTGSMLLEHQHDIVPGTDRTYLDEFNFLVEVYMDELSDHLGEEQVRKLIDLEVSLVEIQNGYDPWIPHIKAAYAKAKLRQHLFGE